ncbi:MAG: hypothetical protein P8L66_03910 [Rhodospirillaceae bacterium]|nr:hypothetical protein [Rhodospirillaceae bacterium]
MANLGAALKERVGLHGKRAILSKTAEVSRQAGQILTELNLERYAAIESHLATTAT